MNPVNKILLGVGAAIALIVVIIFIWLSLENAHLRTELAQAQANGTACHLANDDFTTTVAQQNKAIQKLKTDGILQAQHAQESFAQAQKIAQAYTKAAEKIRNTKAHGDTCKATEKLIDSYLENAR